MSNHQQMKGEGNMIEKVGLVISDAERNIKCSSIRRKRWQIK